MNSFTASTELCTCAVLLSRAALKLIDSFDHMRNAIVLPLTNITKMEDRSSDGEPARNCQN